MNRTDRVKLAAVVVFLGFAWAAAAHYWSTAYDGAQYPLSSYLFNPDDAMKTVRSTVTQHHSFGDLYSVYLHLKQGAPYHPTDIFFASNYLPFLNLVLLPFMKLPYAVVLGGYFALTTGTVFAFLWWATRGASFLDRLLLVSVLTFANYCVQFTLDRGNVESVVFLPVALGCAALMRGGTRTAVLCFAAATAMKGFPGVFLLLFLRRSSLREFGVGLAVVAAASLVGAALLGDGVMDTVEGLFASMDNYSRTIARMEARGPFTTSLFQALWATSQCAGALSLDGATWLLGHVMEAWTAVQLVCIAGALYLAATRRIELWEAATALVGGMLLLPRFSSDYRLLHLLVPFALTLDAPLSRRTSVIMYAAYGIAYSPLGWQFVAPDVRASNILHPLAIALIVGVCVARVWHRPRLAAFARVTAGEPSAFLNS